MWVIEMIYRAFFGGNATRCAVFFLLGTIAGGAAMHQIHRAAAARAALQRADIAAQQQTRAQRELLRAIENRHRISLNYQRSEALAESVHTRIIERVHTINSGPAGVVQCLGADGLRELAAAIDNGAPPAAAGGSGPAVPAAE